MSSFVRYLAFTTLALSQATWAVATEWHWDTFGAGSYSGQISLADDTGVNHSFQRYDSGSTPALFGSTSVQSPLVVIAGSNDIRVDIKTNGVASAKLECSDPSEWRVYVTPVTACNLGVGTNIGGFHAWAEDQVDTYVPRMSVFVVGMGWRDLAGHACGRLQTLEICEK